MCAWTLHVSVLPNESISSWMTRAALMQGCDPLTLTGWVWPRWRAWTLDLDRGIETERLAVLSRVSGVPPTTFEQASLRNPVELIAGHRLEDSGTWPWVLALGSRNRKRVAGMQYCPVCLSDDAKPYFRKDWRFAWQTACLIHQTRLLDRCWSCGAPVEPHRLQAVDGHLGVCVECKADLRSAQRFPINQRTRNFQISAQAVMNNASGQYDTKTLAVHEWFAVTRFFVGLVRYYVRNETSSISKALRELRVPITLENSPPLFSLPLELLSPVHRETLFASVSELMTFSGKDLFYAFNSAGVNGNSLQAISGTLPTALAVVTDRLPVNKRLARAKRGCRSVEPKSKRSVLMSWARLRRKIGLPSDE